jgi:hypothetical protein
MPGQRNPIRRNPLRRRSDRIQAWSAFLTIMALMLATPWSAWHAARMTYRDEMRAAQWDRQHRFEVPAVVLEDPSTAVGGVGSVATNQPVTMRVSWTGPDGATRFGLILVEPTWRSGDDLLIWIDDRGALASPPPRRRPAIEAGLIAFLVTIGFLVGLGGLHRAVVWRLDRRRMRDWQAEWLITEPLWRHR